MKQLTMIDLVQRLAQSGHRVDYRRRKDGGILITSIDGIKYTSSTGNATARKMLNVSLSEARTYQLNRIKSPKGIKPKDRKKSKLPVELQKKLKRVQRIWRKEHKTTGGTISTSGVRYHFEHYNLEEALRSLDKAEKYALGIAYEENVEWLAQRIELDLNKDYSDEMSDIVNRIRAIKLTFKEEWIQVIYEIIYKWEQGSIPTDEVERQISQIIGK